MKTDSIYYQLFQTFPGLLFELLEMDPRLAQFYEFSSREVKEIAFRLDGLFIPTQTRDPLYFVEVQFQPDPRFYFRLMAEIHLYLRQYEPENAWQAVVFYPRKSLDPGIPVALSGSASQIRRVYLNKLEIQGSPLVEIVKLTVDPQRRAKNRARVLLDQELSTPVLELLERVLIYKFAKLSREEIEVMFGLTELRQTRVYQEANEEGRQEEGARLAIRLLRRKLGIPSLPDSLEERIRSLPIDQIESLGEVLLDFETLEDLKFWIQTHL